MLFICYTFHFKSEKSHFIHYFDIQEMPNDVKIFNSICDLNNLLTSTIFKIKLILLYVILNYVFLICISNQNV